MAGMIFQTRSSTPSSQKLY
ncbi:DUF6783 domain-containing protein [uncultured Robinsoniella sp.]